MNPPPPNAPKPAFGKPEKTSPVKVIAFWVFVVVGVAGIGWMIKASGSEKRLNCSNSGPVSLLSFGNCVEE